MNKETKVKGGKIREVDSSYVIADEGGWLHGSYDSLESAKLAISRKTWFDWNYLVELSYKVNVVQCRDITLKDLEVLK